MTAGGVRARAGTRGLIDEYRLVLCPLALGSGRSLFGNKVGPIGMKLLDARTLDRGAVSLRSTRKGTAAEKYPFVSALDGVEPSLIDSPAAPVIFNLWVE